MASLKRRKDHRGPFWEVRWRGPEGERRRRFRSKAAADREFAVATAEESKRRDPVAFMADAEVSLGFVIDKWWKAESPTWEGTTTLSREGVLKNHIPASWKRRAIRSFHRTEIQDLVTELSNEVGTETGRKVKSLLKLVWEFGLNAGYVNDSPVSSVKLRRKRDDSAATFGEIEPIDPKEVLSPDQVHEIADAIGSRFKPLVLTLGMAGLRIGEAAVLRVGDLDLDEAVMTVRQARDAAPLRLRRDGGVKPPKNDRIRQVYIDQVLVDVLRPLVEDREETDWVFTAERGGRLHVDNWRKRKWRPAVEKLGFRQGPYEFTNPHWLRHTTASSMLKAGVNPSAICAQLGWADLGTFFKVYAGFFAGDADDIRRAMRETWAKESEDKSESAK